MANAEFDTTIGGLQVKARQFVGIGHLNVSTSRGELKLLSGDYILKLPNDETVVLSEEMFLRLVEEQTAVEMEGSDPLDSSSTLGSSEASTSSKLESSSGTAMSFTDLKAKAERGEKLTDEEELRLLDGK